MNELHTEGWSGSPFTASMSYYINPIVSWLRDYTSGVMTGSSGLSGAAAGNTRATSGYCIRNVGISCNDSREYQGDGSKVSQTAEVGWADILANPAVETGPKTVRKGYGMRRQGDDGVILARIAIAVFTLVVGLPLLIWFGWLREIPVFWMNEGGYPIWLREVVLDLFYPLFFLDFFAMLIYVALLLRVPPRTKESMRLNLAVLSAMAIGVVFAVIYALADNVMLLLQPPG